IKYINCKHDDKDSEISSIDLIDMRDYSHEIKHIFEKVYKSRWNNTHHYAIPFFGIKNENLKWLTIGVSHLIQNSMSVHAEMDAITKMNKYLKVMSTKEKLNLLVVRLTKTGVICESRPCYHCLVRLQKYCDNINYIYYSTSD